MIRAALCLALLLLTACGVKPTEGWQQMLVQCPTEEQIGRLEPRNRIEIRVYGEENMTGEYEVSSSGTIEFPLLGPINVLGLRCDEVTAILTQQLGAQYLRNPSVSCIHKDIQRSAVSVDGAVRQAGSIPFRKGLMLTDAIAESQGMTVRANSDAVIITRRTSEVETLSVVVPYSDIVQAKAPNVCLHPGDVIYVPEVPY